MCSGFRLAAKQKSGVASQKARYAQRRHSTRQDPIEEDITIPRTSAHLGLDGRISHGGLVVRRAWVRIRVLLVQPEIREPDRLVLEQWALANGNLIQSAAGKAAADAELAADVRAPDPPHVDVRVLEIDEDLAVADTRDLMWPKFCVGSTVVELQRSLSMIGSM